MLYFCTRLKKDIDRPLTVHSDLFSFPAIVHYWNYMKIHIG